MKVSGSENTVPVIVITGPTASGKTEVAIELAMKIGAEIISADSRQIYKNLTIGTAKPTSEQLNRVSHHFVDILHPSEEFSAGQFSRQARRQINNLRSQNINVVVTGGSGMYIESLLDGFFEPEISNKRIQQQLKDRAQIEGSEVLHTELQNVDPERAAELQLLDSHRIVRSLEIYYETGKKHSEWLKQPRIAADFPFILFALNWPRPVLYERIEKRVDRMLEQGLIAEVESVLGSGITRDTNSLLTVGYREVVQYLDNELSYDAMVDKIKQHTRNYAKRQMTWFKRDKRIQWIDCNEKSAHQIVDEILNALNIP
ncbi:MAG: tRNA (adenosine(37)-N6)-dimethylallyltransferase MiaA [Calditrichaeota bacterium]|nr:MAG: tRNA (adenosine(37)-N6)-dimethylallyltransferase MiaA [Calditrichota bacterium]